MATVKESEMDAALRSLYIAVAPEVAEDVETKVRAYVAELQAEIEDFAAEVKALEMELAGADV